MGRWDTRRKSADAVTHGTDASGSGEANAQNALDAIHTAAAYLCAHGADTPEGARETLYAYDNSDSYVDEVFTIANSYADEQDQGSAIHFPAPRSHPANGQGSRDIDRVAVSRGFRGPHRSHGIAANVRVENSERVELRSTSLPSGGYGCSGWWRVSR